MVLIIVVAILGTAVVLLRPGHAFSLAGQITGRTVILAVAGAGIEAIGLWVGSTSGHILVVVGLALLLMAAWPLQRWPGGWLLLLGLMLNAVAMASYGRMPIIPEAFSGTGLSYSLGTVLPGTKDVVAEGWMAHWLGDRFVLELPIIHHTTIWSIGDLLLLGGICRAAIGQERYVRATT